MYFYNLNMKTIEHENLDLLFVYNQQPTKLPYYPSLVVENQSLCCGGIFLANEKVKMENLEKLCINDALFIGDSEKLKAIKKNLK